MSAGSVLRGACFVLGILFVTGDRTQILTQRLSATKPNKCADSRPDRDHVPVQPYWARASRCEIIVPPAKVGPDSLSGPATSYHSIWPAVLGANYVVPSYWQGELKDGTPWFIRAGPQPPPGRLDDRTADRQAHAHPGGFGRVEGLEQTAHPLRS